MVKIAGPWSWGWMNTLVRYSFEVVSIENSSKDLWNIEFEPKAIEMRPNRKNMNWIGAEAPFKTNVSIMLKSNDVDPSIFTQDIVLKINVVREEIIDKLGILKGVPEFIKTDHDEYIKKEKEFIRNTNKPILGICLGLQIFGAMFGSKLFELDRLRKGFFNFELHEEKGICYFNHKWFVKDAPPEFEVLRRNEEIIEALRHKTKPFLGVQCHPEISGEYGEKIKKIFIEKYVKPSLDSSTTKGSSSLPKASD